jgi:hypothetical protein
MVNGQSSMMNASLTVLRLTYCEGNRGPVSFLAWIEAKRKPYRVDKVKNQNFILKSNKIKYEYEGKRFQTRKLFMG